METASPAPAALEQDPGSGLFGATLGFLAAHWKVVASIVAVALLVYFFAGESKGEFSGKGDVETPGDGESDPDVMRLVSAVNS